MQEIFFSIWCQRENLTERHSSCVGKSQISEVTSQDEVIQTSQPWNSNPICTWAKAVKREKRRERKMIHRRVDNLTNMESIVGLDSHKATSLSKCTMASRARMVCAWLPICDWRTLSPYQIFLTICLSLEMEILMEMVIF